MSSFFTYSAVNTNKDLKPEQTYFFLEIFEDLQSVLLDQIHFFQQVLDPGYLIHHTHPSLSIILI